MNGVKQELKGSILNSAFKKNRKATLTMRNPKLIITLNMLHHTSKIIIARGLDLINLRLLRCRCLSQ